MNRRSFTVAAGAAAGAAAPRWWREAAWASGARRADTVFRGALVFDGTGAPPVPADVAVLGDRIQAVGPGLDTAGASVIDARGLALAPGFIDIHSHTDLELLIEPLAHSKVRQGVTTEVVGQDGSSIGPWTDGAFESTRDSYRERYGATVDFRDVPGLFAHLEREPASLNLASMVGTGTVRGFVVGNDDRPATAAELDAMLRVVDEALAAGACGVSSGLEYVPGAFADLSELVALAGRLDGRGLPYASHMRNEDDQLFAAIEEALHVGRLAGVPVQISHLKAQGQRNWWKAETALRMIEEARADGVDAAFDRYPYVAYSTGLTSLFPVWSRDGGRAALLDRLREPETQPRIRREVEDKVAKLGSWDAVQITSTGSDDFAWARGRRMGELAAERGVEPYALLEEIIVGDRARAGMVGFGMSEANTARMLAHPLGMVCSDGSALATEGPLSEGSPHPRSYGTFPRILGHYCRDEEVMPLEVGIHKMTGMPAERLRFADRGRIAPGYHADLVVFDPDTVRDNATFAEPHRYPAGIEHVMVNGTLVVRHGDHTGARPGRIVRP